MLKYILILGVSLLFAENINFDFIDARKKGYTDKEILDYVSKNLNNYDINSVRQIGFSDKEIVDFFIQRDSVNKQIKALSNNKLYSQVNKSKIYPQEISYELSIGCEIYTGKLRQYNDNWTFVAKLIDFSTAIYTAEYLKEAKYFDIKNSEGITLKNICAKWLNKLNTNEEIKKLYALSLMNEINKLVKQQKALIIE